VHRAAAGGAFRVEQFEVDLALREIDAAQAQTSSAVNPVPARGLLILRGSPTSEISASKPV